MERWRGRVALVTGASAGIGAAIVKELVLKGMIVVGVARRVNRVEALKAELTHASGSLYPVACDITQEYAILEAFEWVAKTFGGVDVLINNAGVVHDSTLSDGSTDNWKSILDVNVLGLSMCIREAVKSMKARGVDDGHIININSICGHKVTPSLPITMYCASKYAVTALTEGLRAELIGTKIKTTSLSPGLVRTELYAAGKNAAGEAVYEQAPFLDAKDVSDAVLYVLGTPPNVQITELTIKPIGEML